MKRKNFFKMVSELMMVMILAVGLIGCSGTASVEKNPPAADPESVDVALAADPESNDVTPASDAGSVDIPQVKLTFAAPHTPPQTYALVDEKFINDISDASGGKITMEYFPGGTLIGGNEAAAELAQGVADLGYPRIGYSKNGYDLNNMSMIWMYNNDPTDWEKENEIYQKVYANSLQMAEEWTGIKPYGLNAGGQSVYLFMREPINSLADLKGKTIRATGVWGEVVKGLGGEPIVMPISETYLALEKGTVDGTLGLPATALMAERLAEVVKYTMDLKINQAPYYAWAFNLDKWNSLDPKVQKIFNDYESTLEADVVKRQMEEVQPAIDYTLGLKVQMVIISDAEKETVNKVMDEVNRAAAAKLDEKGLKCTEAYEYTQKLIKESLVTTK